MKVETNIITSVSVSPMERAVILVIMYVKTFKTDIIDFIGQIRMCLIDHFLYHSPFIDTHNITQWNQRENVWIFYK
jgi:hypothetical protein